MIMFNEFWKEVERHEEAMENAPPPIRGILAVHSVPYGKIFAYWDTNGDMWIWCNRGELEDIPRAIGKERHLVKEIPFGIPIYFNHPYWSK